LEKEDKALVTKQLPVTSPPNGDTGSKSSASTSKRKLEDTEVKAGPAKKMKNGSSASATATTASVEAEIAKQNKQMYKYRDELADFKKNDLKQILSTNKQQVPEPASIDKVFCLLRICIFVTKFTLIF